ncbi:MAG TPA: acyl-CoA dehydrogenase family protein [Solirubrobacteraceae bacterium]|nr:acyl-CoA dehydrogenase family protein [Solirubrobacteraceae bacterium]
MGALMDFALSDEQRAFRDAVAAFARDRLAGDYAGADRRGAFREGLVREMADMGLIGLRIPAEHGGQGADALSTGIAAEEVSRADINAAYLILLPSLVAEVLVGAADQAQRERWLGAIAAGEALPCFCLTEPEHGSDAAHLSLRAQRDGAGWRLSGEKTSISLGMGAHTALVFARTGQQGARGISAFYVQLDDRYVARSPFEDLGERAIGRASLAFDGHPVGADALVGGEGEGFVRCMQGFDYSRALIALMCLACAQQSLDEALDYARQRRAFGQPISRQQAVVFPLVELATQVRAARLLCYEALWRKDRGMPHALEANMTKWWGPRLAVDACHQALLTFGHAAYSEELPQAQRLRDVIGLEIGDGTAQIAKLVAARHLLGRELAP